jgi:hypothetical protein
VIKARQQNQMVVERWSQVSGLLDSTDMSRSGKQPSLDALNDESSKLRSQIASQVDKADDPLELYDRFVKWIFDSYPSEHLPSSGLIELLEEATRRYKADSSYKGDLRYLKLWTLYASLADKPSIVFKFILTNSIGTVYALLFEEYALALERDSRYESYLANIVQPSHAFQVTQLQMKFTALVYNAKHDRLNV